MHRRVFSFGIVLVLGLFFLFPEQAHADFTDSDNTSSGFGGGTHSETIWDGGNTWVELTSSGMEAGSGNFTSRIMDAGASATWSTLSWVPERPSWKELPDNEGVETAYTAGNADMTDNVLLYHLNESSGTIEDTSGNSIDGTVTGATYSATGRFKTALSFDGTDDQVSIADNSVLNMNGSNLTVSVWVKYTDASHAMTFVSVGKSTYGTRFLLASDGTAAGSVLFGLEDTSSGALSCYYNAGSGVVNVKDGNWHHIVGTRSGATITVYIDGTSRSYLTSAGCINVPDNNLLGEGSYADYNGTLDEVGIWSRALSGTEVSDMYKRGILRLKYQVRSCDDGACSGESFIGPDGTNSTYFSELTTSTLGLPSKSISGLVADNQYFQYKSFFESSDTGFTLSPELNSVTIADTIAGAVPEFSEYMFIFTLVVCLGYVGKYLLPKYSHNHSGMA